MSAQPPGPALLEAAREYLRARDAHEGAARGTLMHLIAQVAEVAAGAPLPVDGGWTEAEVIDEDGIALTVCVGGEEPDGQIRHRWKMPTAVVLERAERALEAATAAAPPGDLRDAARDLLAERRETIYGYRPDVPWEVARNAARWQRHRDVRERLRALTAGAEETAP